MVNIDNIRALVSSVELDEYRNNIGAIAMLFVGAAVAGGLAIDINVFATVSAIVLGIILIAFLFLLIKKDYKRLFLFNYLQGSLVVLSICMVVVNILHDKDFFVITIITVLATMFVSTLISVLLVKRRIQNNYYINNQRSSIDVVIIPTIGILSAIAGNIIAEGLGCNDMFILFIAVVLAAVNGLKMTEILIKYIVVRKYKLYNSMRINSIYQRRF